MKKPFPEVVLDREIPRLRVRRAIVAVDGESVGNGRGGHRIQAQRVKTIRQRPAYLGAGVHAREPRWRKPRGCCRQFQSEGNVRLPVVINPVARPHDGRTLDERHLPGQADARRKIPVIRIDQAGWKRTAVRSGDGGRHDRHTAETGRDIQIGHFAVLLLDSGGKNSQRKPRFSVRLALTFQSSSSVSVPVILREVHRRAILDGGGLRHAEQKVGEIEAGSGDRQRRWHPTRWWPGR